MRRACEALVFVLFVHSTAAAPSPRQDTLVVNEENGPRNDTAARKYREYGNTSLQMGSEFVANSTKMAFA